MWTLRTLEHAVDYFPYGSILREFVNSTGPEKYLTTHHERDVETGLDYRGARFYDSDIVSFPFFSACIIKRSSMFSVT
jgi:hypothetical protein